MGYCTDDQYTSFIDQVPSFEQMLVDDGIDIVKLWFSVSQAEQRTRFTVRRIDAVRRWKLSPTDIESLDRWDDYTAAKETMFLRTSTDSGSLDRCPEQRQAQGTSERDAPRPQHHRLLP